MSSAKTLVNSVASIVSGVGCSNLKNVRIRTRIQIKKLWNRSRVNLKQWLRPPPSRICPPMTHSCWCSFQYTLNVHYSDHESSANDRNIKKHDVQLGKALSAVLRHNKFGFSVDAGFTEFFLSCVMMCCFFFSQSHHSWLQWACAEFLNTMHVLRQFVLLLYSHAPEWRSGESKIVFKFFFSSPIRELQWCMHVRLCILCVHCFMHSELCRGLHPRGKNIAGQAFFCQIWCHCWWYSPRC